MGVGVCVGFWAGLVVWVVVRVGFGVKVKVGVGSRSGCGSMWVVVEVVVKGWPGLGSR